MRRPQRYDVSVFLNCPFDDGYRPLLHAAIFAIQDCGFLARTALEDVGSGETRLDKIARIIGEFFRQPDPFLGFLFAGATMGQLLSLPMLALGLFLIARAKPSV